MVPLACTKCKAPLAKEALNPPGLVTCLSCGTAIRADVFPALFRTIAPGHDGEILMVDSESSCFYHPAKRASVLCESCGRFLCALCDMEINERHLCPACLETGKKKDKLKSLENRRVLYDNIALAIAVVPIIFVFPTLITAPAAIFVALWYWRAPSSIAPRTKIRFILAILIALAEILGWTIFFASLIFG